MDYRESTVSSSSYTPRRRDGKYEIYSGLQLKTRQPDEDNHANERLKRSSYRQEVGDLGQQENRGVSKRRESFAGGYGNSKYLYEVRHDDEAEHQRASGREDNAMREIRGRENR